VLGLLSSSQKLRTAGNFAMSMQKVTYLMRFNPRNVIILLSVVFSALDFPESPITSEKLITEQKLEDMLKEIYEDQCEIEEEKSLDFLNSFDVPKAEVELINEEENYAYHVKEMLCDR